MGTKRGRCDMTDNQGSAPLFAVLRLLLLQGTSDSVHENSRKPYHPSVLPAFFPSALQNQNSLPGSGCSEGPLRNKRQFNASSVASAQTAIHVPTNLVSQCRLKTLSIMFRHRRTRCRTSSISPVYTTFSLHQGAS